MSADRFENSLGVFASLCEAAGAGPPYMDAKPSPAKLAKGEDLCDAILGVRGEMAQLEIELAGNGRTASGERNPRDGARRAGAPPR